VAEPWLSMVAQPLPCNISSHHADDGLRLTKAASLLPRAASGRPAGLAQHLYGRSAQYGLETAARSGKLSCGKFELEAHPSVSLSWRRGYYHRPGRAGGAAPADGEVERGFCRQRRSRGGADPPPTASSPFSKIGAPAASRARRRTSPRVTP
jgi:hypothetical protein